MSFFLLLLVPYASLAPWWAAGALAGDLPALTTPHPGVLHFKPAQDAGGDPPEAGSRPDLGPAPGAAVDGPSRRPSLPCTPAEARRLSKDWEAKPMGAGWRILLSRRFALRSDAKVDEIRTVAAWAEVLLDAVHAKFEGDLADLRLSLRLFADPGEFAAYASCRGADGARSFYDEAHAEAVLVRPASGAGEELARHLAHELVHLYLDRTLPRPRPAWVSEGLAEVYGDYEVKDGKLGFRDSADPAPLASALEEGRLLPLAKLAALEPEEFRGEGWSLRYAAAASLVRFLGRRDPKAAWALARGKSLEGYGDPAALEKAWHESIRAK